MSSGAKATIALEDKEIRAVDSDELAQGLMLVRASTIRIVRLQLAIERRDRRLALQTVDDLVDLDGKIRDFLGELPSSAVGLVPMQEIEDQRSWLAREKLTLAAGTSRSAAMTGVRGWIEPPSAEDDDPAEPITSEVEPSEPAEPHEFHEFEEKKSPMRRGLLAVSAVCLLLLAIALAYATFFSPINSLDDLISRISLPQGGS